MREKAIYWWGNLSNLECKALERKYDLYQEVTEENIEFMCVQELRRKEINKK